MQRWAIYGSALTAWVLLTIGAASGAPQAQTEVVRSDPGADAANAADAADAGLHWSEALPVQQWCWTYERYLAGRAARGEADFAARVNCPFDGACDDPLLRDAAMPTAQTPWKTIRVVLNVFCRSDGLVCAATEASVDAQMLKLNQDFAPHRIRFVYTARWINRTRYFSFQIEDEAGMKTRWALEPDRRLNVYVVDTGGFSFGRFPWTPVALTAMGGVVINMNSFGADQTVLTHEVGHNLGLWHTHHGVSEVPPCSACYEQAGGANDGDTTGDRCSDTAPTPTNFTCDRPGGSDSCSGNRWRRTDYENQMGYAPSSCRTTFSMQQAGRMHCWTDAVLASWLVSCPTDVNGDGRVDLSDLARVLLDFGTSGAGMLTDINDNGTVDIGDLAALLLEFGRSCP